MATHKCIYVSPEVHALLKHLSIELDTTIKALVEQFITDGIKVDAQHDMALRHLLKYLPSLGP